MHVLVEHEARAVFGLARSQGREARAGAVDESSVRGFGCRRRSWLRPGPRRCSPILGEVYALTADRSRSRTRTRAARRVGLLNVSDSIADQPVPCRCAVGFTQPPTLECSVADAGQRIACVIAYCLVFLIYLCVCMRAHTNPYTS
jgi:hypothetical protein